MADKVPGPWRDLTLDEMIKLARDLHRGLLDFKVKLGKEEYERENFGRMWDEVDSVLADPEEGDSAPTA